LIKNKRKPQLVFHTKNKTIKIKDEEKIIEEIYRLADMLSNYQSIKLVDFSKEFEKITGFSFMLFSQSDNWDKFKKAGLILIK
jgi:hypothetical protein